MNTCIQYILSTFFAQQSLLTVLISLTILRNVYYLTYETDMDSQQAVLSILDECELNMKLRD